MKKVIALLGVIAFVSAIPVTPVMAQSDQAATITKDGLCGGAVPDGEGGFGPFIATTNSLSVVTNSGVTTLTCHFDLEEGTAPTRATRASGFACGTFLGVTNNSRIVASPGGHMVLICRVNNAKPSA